MATQKFEVGQTVKLVPALPARYSPSGEYEILRRIPEENGETCYRVKSQQDPRARVVRESLLRIVKG
jgi:hypothetical protein